MKVILFTIPIVSLVILSFALGYYFNGYRIYGSIVDQGATPISMGGLK